MNLLKVYINKVLSLFGYSVKKNKKISTLENILIAHNYFLYKKINEFEDDPFLNYIKKNFQFSNSSLLQDCFALWVNNNINDGYFVEFGAGNGVDFSNTFLLKKRGWNGLLIEPGSNFENCTKSRFVQSLNFAVTSKSNETLFLYETLDKNFSTLNSTKNAIKKKVLTITLSDALQFVNAPRYINFLSIDTEGSEFDALLGLDFNKYFVKCLVVEHNFNSLNRKKIYELLVDNNFKRVYENATLYEDWYINEK